MIMYNIIHLSTGIEMFSFWISETQGRITVTHIYLCKSRYILKILNNIHYMKKIKLSEFVYKCMWWLKERSDWRTKLNPVIAIKHMTTFNDISTKASLSTGKLYDKKNLYSLLFIQLIVYLVSYSLGNTLKSYS